jgi:hypothetical protein
VVPGQHDPVGGGAGNSDPEHRQRSCLG